jgi:hypothetical protein
VAFFTHPDDGFRERDLQADRHDSMSGLVASDSPFLFPRHLVFVTHCRFFRHCRADAVARSQPVSQELLVRRRAPAGTPKRFEFKDSGDQPIQGRVSEESWVWPAEGSEPVFSSRSPSIEDEAGKKDDLYWTTDFCAAALGGDAVSSANH